MLQPVPPRWLEVWVDHPHLGGCFTYRVPEGSAPEAGDLLSVPFGQQMAGAVALGWRSELPAGVDPQSVREIEAVVAKGILPKEFWPLLQRVADYYLTPLAQVVRTVLPPGLLSRSQRRVRLLRLPAEGEECSPAAQTLLQLLQAKGGELSWRYVQQQVPTAALALRELQRRGWVESFWQEQQGGRVKTQLAASLADDSPEGLSLPQQKALQILKQKGGELLLAEWERLAGVSRSVLQGLARKGRVHLYERPLLRLGDASLPGWRDPPRPLTAAQAQAVEAIRQALGRFQRFLLHGVTGSGKTEVYLQVIAQVLQQGRSALVLVPEIGLTPQLMDRFRARLGSQVWAYHSGLSEGERYDTWRQMLSSTPQVVIGTRSAVFAPLSKLGLIVLDEEHDDSFKQDQPQPCYHARQVAEWRAELAGCPLVLGSATPAVETYAAHLQDPQRWIRLALPQRIERREGLSLEEALEIAVAQNPAVQQARLTVERAEAGVALAQAAFAPTLSSRANYQYSEAPSPGGGPRRESHTLSASVVRVEYTAFDSGLREQNLKLAQEALRIAQLQLEQTLQTVKQAVANAYYDLQSADARVAISQAAVESSEATLRDAQARERAGLGTRFEILQAETELANNRQTLLVAQNTQQLNRRRLAELLNFPSPTDVLASDRIEPMGEWDLSLEETIIAAFAQRQELERRRRELEQAQSRVRLAQARNGPRIGLFASLDAVNDFNASRDSFDVGYSVGANFSLTWFDGGEAAAQARQAQIDGQVAVSNFVGTRNEIQRGVEEAFLTLSSSREQIDSAKVAIASAEESLRLARLRLQAGVGTQTEVINAEAALTTARGNLSNAVIAYNRALVQLKRAIGSL